MINKFIDWLVNFPDNLINFSKKLGEDNLPKKKSIRKEEHRKLDRIVNKKLVDDEIELEKGRKKEEDFCKIMEQAHSKLESKIDEFNDFLKKYNLKFEKPENPFYEINGNRYANGSVSSTLFGLEKRIYFSIHFNQNDKDIYEDLRLGKLKFEYNLFEHPSGRIIDTFDFEKLIKEFVHHTKDQLKLRIK